MWDSCTELTYKLVLYCQGFLFCNKSLKLFFSRKTQITKRNRRLLQNNGRTCDSSLLQITETHKRQRTPKGQSHMDNLEKLAIYGTQDEEKQNNNTTQYVSGTTNKNN